MKYVVIHDFLDEQDSNYAYREGDTFPRDGVFASDLRIKDLMNGRNSQKMPLIRIGNGKATFINRKVVGEVKETVDVKKPTVNEVVDEPVAEKPSVKAEFTAEDIDKMPFMKLKSVAKKNGIPVEDREAKEIRDDLKKEFGV